MKSWPYVVQAFICTCFTNLDNSVKYCAVVVATASKFKKVLACPRRVVVVELDGEIALVCDETRYAQFALQLTKSVSKRTVRVFSTAISCAPGAAMAHSHAYGRQSHIARKPTIELSGSIASTLPGRTSRTRLMDATLIGHFLPTLAVTFALTYQTGGFDRIETHLFLTPSSGYRAIGWPGSQEIRRETTKL